MKREDAVVLAFNELGASQGADAGGKASALSRMFQAGYPVPDGFVILPGAFAGDELLDVAWQGIARQLGRLRGEDGPVAFAVRSSALSEDSAEASFAGEFESVLNVRQEDELRQAVQQVRCSRHGSRVQAYSRQQGVSAAHEIAVIVQRMVRSELAGVLFTVDPVTGDRSAMIGNHVEGLGDSLVSGEATGESFRLQRPFGRYHGPQELKRHARTLYRLAARIEQELGCPQDIEWAVADGRLYLLQSRPITTLHGHQPMTGEFNDSLMGDFLWSSVNVGEAYMQVMTPFTWSMVQAAFSDMSLLPGNDLLGNIGGRPYFNVSITASVIRALGRNVEDMVNEVAGGANRMPDGMNFPQIPLPRWAVLPLLFSGMRMQWKQWLGYKRCHRFLAGNLQWCQQMVARIEAARSNEELLELWYGETAAYAMKHFWSMGASAYQYGELVGRLRRELSAMVDREEADILLSNVSSESELLASLGPAVGLWRLYRGEITRERFLEQYGHRGPNEGEYLVPRPAEDPEWLERQLGAFARSPVDVEALLARQRDRFENAWRRFAERYPRKANAVRRRLEEAAEAARLREAVRSEMMRLIWVSRKGALRAGEMTGLGDDVFFLNIQELEDILRGRPTTAPQWLQARREAYDRYRALPPYPELIRGRFDPFAWAADPNRRSDVYDGRAVGEPAEEGVCAIDVLRGAAGSAGRAEGLVRRLDSPEESDTFRTGEILVSTQTNIGWTLIFPRAAAIVTDVGAPLSHAAIVARELGIPAVVGCGDATARLRTGDRVLVDGSQGLVQILEKPTGQPEEEQHGMPA